VRLRSQNLRQGECLIGRPEYFTVEQGSGEGARPRRREWSGDMRISTKRMTMALAVAALAATGGISAIPSAHAAEDWNCRVVVAQDISWFLYPTGSTKTYPYVLRYGDKFRSYGVENGRFRGVTWTSSNHYWGWADASGRWTDRLPDSECS
jgi:hypothetical protein